MKAHSKGTDILGDQIVLSSSGKPKIVPYFIAFIKALIMRQFFFFLVEVEHNILALYIYQIIPLIIIATPIQ